MGLCLQRLECTDGNMESAQNTDPLGKVLEIFSFLGDSLDILNNESTVENVKIELFLVFAVVFTIAFMLVLSFLLCSCCDCKRRIREREQLRDFMESDISSDSSGSWVNMDSSTQVAPLVNTIEEEDDEHLEEVYWFRQDPRPSLVV